MTSSRWTLGSCVSHFPFSNSQIFPLANAKSLLPTSKKKKKKDGAPCFRHPLLQADSQYNRSDVQGKGRSHGEASDRATELRRCRDRICRYAHGRSQQRRIGLSRLCVTSRALNIHTFTTTIILSVHPDLSLVHKQITTAVSRRHSNSNYYFA
jgi:hypothetical protein